MNIVHIYKKAIIPILRMNPIILVVIPEQMRKI